MRTINISKNYENITIPFDDGTSFSMRADFRQENVSKALRILERNNTKANQLMGVDDEQATKGAIEILEEIFMLVIGSEQYESLVQAIGGEDAKPENVSFQLTIIWVELVDMIKQRAENFSKSKASHYLSEYYGAVNGNAN